jgi:hypothetical protein
MCQYCGERLTKSDLLGLWRSRKGHAKDLLSQARTFLRDSRAVAEEVMSAGRMSSML